MSKRRGKNRPKKLGPSLPKGPPPVVVRPCSTCFDLVDREQMIKATDECGRCWKNRMGAYDERSY